MWATFLESTGLLEKIIHLVFDFSGSELVLNLRDFFLANFSHNLTSSCRPERLADKGRHKKTGIFQKIIR